MYCAFGLISSAILDPSYCAFGLSLSAIVDPLLLALLTTGCT